MKNTSSVRIILIIVHMIGGMLIGTEQCYFSFKGARCLQIMKL